MIARHLVCFAHGKESGPWGTKITRLAETARRRGFEVISPDYSHTHDPRARLAQLCNLRPQAQRALVLAGSSMGGWVSAMACADLQPNALLLIAPALYFAGFDDEPPTPPYLTRVVHGWDDDIVPVDRAIRYAQKHRAPLHLLDSGHTLNDRLSILELLFDQLLQHAVLDAAYRAADYFVSSAGANFRLRIGTHDPLVDFSLVAHLGVKENWTMLTACNPASQPLSEAENQARMKSLWTELEQAGIKHSATHSQDPDGEWPNEIGVLLCDPPPGFSQELGRRHGQNAIVRGQIGAAPELLWL